MMSLPSPSSEGMAEEKKPLETTLTILVAVAATLAAFSGYLASLMNDEEGDLRALASRYLSDANTHLIQANQIILRDESLLLRADQEERAGNRDVAVELRHRTFAYREGFIDENGNATAAYGGNWTAAKEAYFQTRYRPYEENRTASLELAAAGEEAGERGLDFLFSTVLLALAVLLGISGLSVAPLLPRKLLVYMVVGMIAIAMGFVIFTAFG